MGTNLSSGLYAVVQTVCLTFLLGCGQQTEFAAQDIPKIPYDREQIITKSFAAGGLLTETVHIDPKKLSYEHDLYLTEKPSIIVSTKQIERSLLNESFTQGGSGRDYLDSYPVLESGFLDLLIVIDDSQSMTMFQQLIKDRLADLLGQISNTNWRIAVATTSSPCLRTTFDNTKILTRYDYDRFPLLTHQRFEELIYAGNAGSTIERGIYVAAQALRGDCGDAAFPWTRESSQKVVLIVSDEKNCGSASNEGCEDEEYAKAEYFTSRAPQGTKVYGLLLFTDNFAECPDSGGYDNQHPIEYEKLIQSTGGMAAEICQSDYSAVLKQVSAHVSQFVKRKFALTFPPDPGSLKVSIDGRMLSSGFILIGSDIELTVDPGQNAQTIAMSYTYGGGQVKRFFDLQSAADPQTMKVYVNGELVSPDRYTILEKKTIAFTDVPPMNASLNVNYRVDEQLPREFVLDWPANGSLDGIYINSIRVDDQKVACDQSQSKVIFDNPPMDGSVVELRYKEPDAKTLVYQVPVYEGRTIESVDIFDPTRPEDSLDTQYVDGAIIFSPHEIWNGRKLILRVQLAAREDDYRFNFTIPESAIEDSIVVRTLSGEDCNDHVSLEGTYLSVSCLSSVEDGLTVDYTYVVGFTTSFLVSEEDDESDLWRVYLNNREIHSYQRHQGLLTIDESLVNPADKVVVEIYPSIAKYTGT